MRKNPVHLTAGQKKRLYKTLEAMSKGRRKKISEVKYMIPKKKGARRLPPTDPANSLTVIASVPYSYEPLQPRPQQAGRGLE